MPAGQPERARTAPRARRGAAGARWQVARDLESVRSADARGVAYVPRARHRDLPRNRVATRGGTFMNLLQDVRPARMAVTREYVSGCVEQRMWRNGLREDAVAMFTQQSIATTTIHPSEIRDLDDHLLGEVIRPDDA